MAAFSTVSFRRPLLGAALAFLTLANVACKKDDDDPQPTANTVSLELEHVGADGTPLTLNTKTYHNKAGNHYVVTSLKYFVSSVQLTRADGTIWQEPNSYHLITAGGTDNPVIELKDVPLGDYNKVTFAVGVDPIANTRTDHVGDLDPNSDMAWNWNTGYKFLAFEGKQVLGAAPGAGDPAIVIHTGTAPTYRPVTLALPTNATVKANIAPEAHLSVDVNAIMGGPNTLDFGTAGLILMGGDAQAQQVADNYATMFAVEHVHNDAK